MQNYLSRVVEFVLKDYKIFIGAFIGYFIGKSMMIFYNRLVLGEAWNLRSLFFDNINELGNFFVWFFAGFIVIKLRLCVISWGWSKFFRT